MGVFFMITKKNNQIVQMELFRRIYHEQLTKEAKRNKHYNDCRHSTIRNGHSDRGYIYTTKNCENYTYNRSYKTLLHQAQEQIYYTPNTFYRNDQRTQANLRFLNAFVLDIDVKNGQNTGLTVSDLLDRVADAGLSIPSLIVRTPSGGFHVYFMLETPRKAYTNALQQYHRIQKAIAREIGADLNAIGAERVFRIPTIRNIVFQSDFNVSFEEMNDWYWINHSELHEQPRMAGKWLKRKGQTLLDHPAFQVILKGVQEGSRDKAAYTLALAYKAQGTSWEDAEEELHKWNSRLDVPLPEKEIERKIKSAYFGSKHGPGVEFVEELSGMSFSYQIYWEPAKPRSERTNSHFNEWAEDILKSLEDQTENKITGSQRKLADFWGMSLSSFQHVMEKLIASEKITVEVTGKGRGAKTTITLILDPIDQEAEDGNSATDQSPKRESHDHSKNVPNSNTNNLVKVVGGPCLFVTECIYYRFRMPGMGGSPP